MEGWICLYRKFLEWQWYSDINVRVVFIHLLLKANHKDKKWLDITIKRGQLVTSISNLANEIGITNQKVRTALDKLKNSQEITIKTTNKYTLINIEKYNDYQDKEKENNKENNKQITNNQQTNNKQITTNNNDNNITMKQYIEKENIKEKALSETKVSTSDIAKASKHKYGKYKNVLLKDEELQKLKVEYSNWEELITYLDEYIEMKGYKAKSHYLCIKKWVIDAVKKNKKTTSSIPDWVEDWANGKE